MTNEAIVIEGQLQPPGEDLEAAKKHCSVENAAVSC